MKIIFRTSKRRPFFIGTNGPILNVQKTFILRRVPTWEIPGFSTVEENIGGTSKLMVGGGAWFNIWREHEGGTTKKTNYLYNTCTVV